MSFGKCISSFERIEIHYNSLIKLLVILVVNVKIAHMELVCPNKWYFNLKLIWVDEFHINLIALIAQITMWIAN
jgi:hypothetical protein